MGVNLFAWALFLLSIIGISKAAKVGVQDYVQCAYKLLSLTRDNACMKVKKIVSCTGGIVDAKGLQQQCSDDTQAYPYCYLLSYTRQTRLVVGSYTDADLCKMYQRVKFCYESECGLSGKQFVKTLPTEEYISEEECPIESTEACIYPVDKITDVTENSCVAVSRARSCYKERLNSCGGSSEQMRAVTMIMVGLTDHIAQCVVKEYGFSKYGEKCMPNPIDAFVTPNLIALEESLKDGYDEENCKVIESMATNLEDFMKTCNDKSTDYTLRSVKDTISKLKESRLGCIEAGFNLPENGGFKGQANRDVMTFFAIVSVVAIFKMRF